MSEYTERDEYPDFFLGDTPKEAEEVYLEFSQVLNQIARSYSIVSGLPREDLFGEAVMALADAKRAYDPEGGKRSFKTFAIYRIKWVLNAYVYNNTSTVRAPAYLCTANGYINSIKYLLSKYSLSYDEEREVLMTDGTFSCKYEEVRKYLDKLKELAARHNLDYVSLIERAEFLPSDVRLSDYESVSDLIERENEIMRAALVVNQMKEHMDDVELSIANGIMEGKSLKEIADEHDKSYEWVRLRLLALKNRLKEKFKDE